MSTPNKFNIPQSAFQITRPIESPSTSISRNTTPKKANFGSTTPRKGKTTPGKKAGSSGLTLTPNVVILSVNSLINFRDKYMKQDNSGQTEPYEIATC